VLLQAVQDITVQGQLALGAVGAALVLDAGGSITMAAGARLQTTGGNLSLQAHGSIALGLLDTRHGADLAAAGGVMLVSEAGTISDAASDEAVNVHAQWLLMRGRGPALLPGQTTTPAAIDVDASKVDIDDGGGLILRDTGADGRTRFNLLSGGILFQQAVAEGGPMRSASATVPAGATVSATGSAQIAEWLSALRPLSELRQTPQYAPMARMMIDAALPPDSAAAAYLAALKATGADGLPVPRELGAELRAALRDSASGQVLMSADELLADASFGLAGRLEQAWLLGSRSQQPASAGLRSVGSDRFDIWEDSLAL
jgi:hypothetical protein